MKVALDCKAKPSPKSFQ